MRKILIVGLPFFASKYGYMMNSYLDIDVEAKVLLNSCDTKCNEPYDIIFSGTHPLKRMCSFIKTLYTFKPDYIDCYDYSILSLYYVVVAKLLRVKVRFWLIGGELKEDKTHLNKSSYLLNIFIKIKSALTRTSLRYSDVIIAKELHHLESIKSINKNLVDKVVSLHNCVPVEGTFKAREKVTKDFIYANAVIESRNVLTFVDALSSLKRGGFKFSASIYGFNSISNEVYGVRAEGYSNRVLNKLEKANLENEVSAHGFIKNIDREMVKYKFFVFPADIIFANYALLEAMSNGLVPIVFPGNGYEKIITDGENGIVAFDFNLQSALERALSLSDAEYDRMSLLAYQKIKSEFSISEWSSKLLGTF
jgi:glycosyltransferase involved in cell wall biosynthesis